MATTCGFVSLAIPRIPFHSRPRDVQATYG
jgi:hypothetical protein